MTTAGAVSGSMVEFLRWIDAEPRTYDETMDAWRTSCPRLSVWEDAVIDGYIVLERSETGALVRPTDPGHALLAR